MTTESVLMTSAIGAKQDRDAMNMGVTNALVKTEAPQGDKRVMMKIRGEIIDMLLEIDPEKHKDFMIGEDRNKVSHAYILKEFHGMLMASVLRCNKFRKGIEAEGYKVKPCDTCVANKTMKGKQLALTWHVDNAKELHADSKVNEKFHKWSEKKHSSDELGRVTATRGKRMTT